MGFLGEFLAVLLVDGLSIVTLYWFFMVLLPAAGDELTRLLRGE